VAGRQGWAAGRAGQARGCSESSDEALQLAAPAPRGPHAARSTQQALKEESLPIPLANGTRSPAGAICSQVHGSSHKAGSNFLNNFAEWLEETQLSAFSSSISF